MTVEDPRGGNAIEGTFAPGSKVHILFGGTGSTLRIGPGVQFQGTIACRSRGQSVELAGENRLKGQLVLSGHGARVRVGPGTRCNGAVWMNLGEPGDLVEIGADCLFATARFRTSDSHAIWDMETGERLNPSAPIRVGDEVWIAEDVLLLKGADIGRGSVIGARSMVSGPIPAHALAVGTPARVLRSGIRWTRETTPPG